MRTYPETTSGLKIVALDSHDHGRPDSEFGQTFEGLIGFVQRATTLLALLGHHPHNLIGILCQRPVLTPAPQAAPTGSLPSRVRSSSNCCRLLLSAEEVQWALFGGHGQGVDFSGASGHKSGHSG